MIHAIQILEEGLPLLGEVAAVHVPLDILDALDLAIQCGIKRAVLTC
jgi:hypothetical protein